MSSELQILYIEDDKVDRMAFEREVASKQPDYDCHYAATIEEAGKKIGSNDFDVIVSDYLLPDGNAFEIFSLCAECPVVIMTGVGNEEIAVKALKKGGYDYLIKDDARSYLKVLPLTVENVIQRKAAEDRLKLFESAIVSAHDAVIISRVTEQGNLSIEYVNEAFQQISGYQSEEIVGRSPAFLSEGFKKVEDVESVRETISDKEPLRLEFRTDHKDGRKLWLESNLVPVRDDNGSITHWIAITRDITKRKQEIRELEEAKEAALESKKAKQMFLANISHEIRTPMNGIVGMAHLLSQTRLSELQEDYLNAIQTSSRHLVNTINNILDYTKIESGKLQLDEISFSLRELLQAIFKSLSFTAMEKGVTMQSVVDDSVPEYVLGDPVRINQILMNLVENAIKFTEQGYVQVSIFASPMEKNDWVNINFMVEDTGIGIPADKQSKILESFTQATNESTRVHGGTGLGLTIVNELVKLMEGELKIDSGHGSGTTISVRVPLEVNTARNADGVFLFDDGESELRQNRVLLVEDNEINQKVVENLLNDWEIDYVISGDGKAALKAYKAGDFNLILMDVHLPKLDGMEVTQRIREIEESSADSKHIPIIALSATNQQTDIERCLAAGMDDFISKPFDPGELHRIILKHTSDHGREVVEEFENEETETAVQQSEGSNGGKRTAKNGTSSEPEEVIDLEPLRNMDYSSEELVLEMAKIFVESLPEFFEEVEAHLEAERWDELKAAIHKMKPSVNYMGIKKLQTLMPAIEQMAVKRSNLEQIPEKVEEMITLCRKGKRELEEMFGEQLAASE